MSYGIQLINNYGKVSISQEYKNIYFHAKRSGTLPTSRPVKSVVDTGITNSATIPTVYYHIPNFGLPYCPVGVRFTSGQWRIDVYGAQGAPYELYIFVEYNPPLQPWGLRVWGPDSTIYYDSGRKSIACTGTTIITRGADYFWDLYKEVGVFDEWIGYWIIGGGSATIPVSARSGKVCVSAPPAYFGLGHEDYGLSAAFFDVFISCIYRDGNNIRVGSQTGDVYGFEQTKQNAWVASYNWDTLPAFFAPAIMDPLWTSYQVSFIDGSVYD